MADGSIHGQTQQAVTWGVTQNIVHQSPHILSHLPPDVDKSDQKTDDAGILGFRSGQEVTDLLRTQGKTGARSTTAKDVVCR